MNSYYPEEFQVKEFAYKSDLTLDQAKEKYSEWYQERIIEKKPRKTWIFNRRVYDRWLQRIQTEYSVGHRYWCVWVLAVTAMKCGISLEELERDAFGLIERFNKDENPFTKEDVLAALEGYVVRGLHIQSKKWHIVVMFHLKKQNVMAENRNNI